MKFLEVTLKGRKPSLHLVVGGKHPHDVGSATATRSLKGRKGGMTCPKHLKGRLRELWSRHIQPCTWLVSPFDEPKAEMAMRLMFEFESNPRTIKLGKIHVLRALLSDIGLDGGTRKRLAGNDAPSARTEVSRYFDDKPDGAA